MLAEGGVTKWAKSTELKITEFLDEYLINFPQEKVRKSTEKLLYSLFRKGILRFTQVPLSSARTCSS